MMEPHRAKRRARGRPPGGPKGQKVRDYPAILVRLPPEARQILAAVVQTTGLPSWQVVNDMVLNYHSVFLKEKQPELFRAVERLLQKTNTHISLDRESNQ
jgi:hypothetical protein